MAHEPLELLDQAVRAINTRPDQGAALALAAVAASLISIEARLQEIVNALHASKQDNPHP